MSALASTTPPRDVPPDWTTFPADERVPCPLCLYDLRGLAAPRCPECGHASAWPALLAARNDHAYLFEHHPRRNACSFLRTLRAGLLARRFWRTVTPAHAVRPRRLAAYSLIVAAVILLLTVVPILANGWYYWQTAATLRARNITALIDPAYAVPYAGSRAAVIRLYGSAQAYIDQASPAPTLARVAAELWPAVRLQLLLAAYALAWPHLSVALLLLYRRSTRRASVRTAQLYRCAIYASDAFVWIALVPLARLAYVAFLYLTEPVLLSRDPAAYLALLRIPPAAWVAAFLVAAYRLTVAHAVYLRLRPAWLAIPLSQLVLLLLYVQTCLITLGHVPLPF